MENRFGQLSYVFRCEFYTYIVYMWCYTVLNDRKLRKENVRKSQLVQLLLLRRKVKEDK